MILVILPIIFFYLIKQKNSCGIGCLMCQSSTCVICDQKAKYYRIGTLCTFKNLINCDSSSNGERCDICSQNYYADYKSGKCIQIVTATSIENCQYYLYASRCSICKNNFYLQNNICVQVTTVISNCFQYSNGVQCSSCVSGYNLNYDYSSCLAQSDPNCQNIGQISCLVCKNNFIGYQNGYLYNLKYITSDIIRKVNIYNLNYSQYVYCLPNSISNCVQYIDFNHCGICAEGYYLTPLNQCNQTPDEAIPNCFDYRITGVCIQCLSGYYLQNQNTCSTNTKVISNCIQMSISIQNSCISCSNNFYLSQNTCVQRSLSIQNCYILNKISDTCASCLPNFILNASHTNCLTAIQNCLNYDITDTSLKCNTCMSNYYYSSTGCIQISTYLTGCNIYLSNLFCSSCIQGYYINTSTQLCVSHDTYFGSQTLCAAKSIVSKNTCEKCNQNQIFFKAYSYCNQVQTYNLDPNCQVFGTSGACSVCGQGYFFNSFLNICSNIQIVNCSYVDNSGVQCIQCSSSSLENYIPNRQTTQNTCIYTFDYITNSCTTATQTYLIKPTNQIINRYINTCNTCFAPAYSEKFVKSGFCVPRIHLQQNYGGTNINNCQVYNMETNLCVECVFDYINNQKLVLSSDIIPVCVSSCQSTQMIFTNFVTFSTGNQFSFYCQTSTITGCFRGESGLCQDCASTYFLDMKIVDSSTFAYMPMKWQSNVLSQSQSFKSIYNQIPMSVCLKLTSTNGFQVDATTVNTLNIYPETIQVADYTLTSSVWNICKAVQTVTIGGTYFGCAACKFGYTGYYLPNIYNVATFFIATCRAMIDCDSKIYYMGIGYQFTKASGSPLWPLDLWVPCHQCLNTTLIPTFTILKPLIYSSSLPYFSNVGVRSLQSFCDLPGLNSTSTFVTNCGIQFINVSLANSIDQTNVPNPACVACKPGYYPTLNLKNFVQACTLISNCDTTVGLDTFNRCSQCLNGYTLQNQGSICALNQVKYCIQSLDGITCEICSQGYILDYFKTSCLPVYYQKCLSGVPFSNATATSNTGQTPNYFYGGCNICNLGFVVVTTSTYIQNICVTAPLNNTNYEIQNCAQYGTRLNCTACQIGYVLPLNLNNQCIVSIKVQNCLTYDGTSNCLACLQGFVLQNSICLDGNFFIPNCLIFDPINPYNCLSCVDKYVPSPVSPGKNGCFQASIGLPFCLSFNKVLSLTQKLNCTLCANNYYVQLINPNDLTVFTPTCVGIPSINNCQTIDQVTYECLACVPAYYLQSSQSGFREKCILRSNNYTYCQVQDPLNDVCYQCISGYYIKNNICIFKPTGIVGCSLYATAQNCLQCKTGMYFDQTRSCVNVLTSNLIQNCQYYSVNQTCTSCLNGYLMVNSTCQSILISNCLIYATVSTCKICQDQFFLTTSNTCAPGTILNCYIHSSLNHCKICMNLFYADNTGKCLGILSQNQINNCKYYFNSTTCQICTNGALLSQNGLNCYLSSDVPAQIQQYFETNCDSYGINQVCRVCAPGYKFSQNGTCVSCGQNLSNCHFCDDLNQNVCLICKSGTYQDLNGVCIGSPLVVSNGTNVTNTTNVSTNISGSYLENIMIIILYLFVYL